MDAKLIDPVDTRDASAVERAVDAIHAALFPQRDVTFVARVFDWAAQCFEGRFDDYQAVDIGYHDFEHTLQGTLCLARILVGRNEAAAKPRLSADAFQLGIVAILFHDTGYLKRRSDAAGTGAKYTATHVERSCDFAATFLAGKGYGGSDIAAVKNMIRCTGVSASLAATPFQNDVERTIGLALGCADLLGQMAARDYVEKLPLLYEEFAEAARFAPSGMPRTAMFASAEALMASTPAFWSGYVRPRLDADFEGLYRYLADPYPDGPNLYVLRIEDSIARLSARFAAPPT